jgi:phosphatidylinositol alpha-mannosyltransferase
VKIGLVCPYDWAVPGGVQTHVRDLAEALIHLGHDVSVLTPTSDEAALPSYVTSSGRAIAVSYNGSVARVNFGPTAASRVRRWLREGEFDVLHVHEPSAPSTSLIACWAARGPIVGTFHTSNSRSRVLAFAAPFLQTGLEKVTGRIAVSENARQTLVEHLGSDAVLIPNGVACARFARIEGFEQSADHVPTLMFLGRIDEPRKGLQILLAAMPAVIAEVPDVRLLVAGPGDVDDVCQQIPAQVLDHVTFLGLVSEQGKVDALHESDVYVAPNTGGESFGIVLLEAMAAGTAVVASDLEAFRRVLDEGRAGQLFDNEDSASLALVLIETLSDTETRSKFVAAGLARAHEFDWDVVAQSVLDVYASVTVAGQPVREDLKGQLMGKLSRSSGRDR